MDRGDIYLVSLDPIKGHEQRGERRVLVVSTKEFNQLNGVPVVVPITTGGDFARVRGYTTPLTGTGLATQGVILCNQPRTLDLNAHNARRMNERVPDCIMDDVLAKLATILE
jgi:mRNA interferase ChpB